MAYKAVFYWVEHLSLAYRAVNHSFHIQTYQYSLKTLHLSKFFPEGKSTLFWGLRFFSFLKKLSSVLNTFFSQQQAATGSRRWELVIHADDQAACP